MLLNFLSSFSCLILQHQDQEYDVDELRQKRDFEKHLAIILENKSKHRRRGTIRGEIEREEINQSTDMKDLNIINEKKNEKKTKKTSIMRIDIAKLAFVLDYRQR